MISKRFYPLATLAVLLAFAWFLAQRALNVPFHDDILDILEFVLNMEDAKTLEDQLGALFAQYNDHRTSVSRAVYYGLFQLQGEVNFRTLTFVANLALPLLAFLYAYALTPDDANARRVERRHFSLVLLVAVLVLCQPRAYGLMLWAMSSFAFYYVCVYAFLSLRFLQKASPLRFLLALLFAFASTFTLASGQVIWLLGAIYIAWQVWVMKERSPLDLVIWLVVGVLVLALFRYQFSSVNTISQLLLYFWQMPCHQIGYFLAMVGSGLSFGSLPAALVAGVAIVSFICWIMGRDALDRRLTHLHFFTLFMMAAAFIVALGRAPYSYLDYALTERYSFASLNIMLCLLVLVFNRGLPKFRAFGPIFVVMAIVFSIASYRFYTPLMDERMELRIKQYDKKMYWIFGFPFEQTSGIVNRAIALGIYHPPQKHQDD